MDYEVFEKKSIRKWYQMSAEEKRHELETLGQSSHFKLLSTLSLQRKFKNNI